MLTTKSKRKDSKRQFKERTGQEHFEETEIETKRKKITLKKKLEESYNKEIIKILKLKNKIL